VKPNPVLLKELIFSINATLTEVRNLFKSKRCLRTPFGLCATPLGSPQRGVAYEEQRSHIAAPPEVKAVSRDKAS
jgi:hypothetical protein